eukprot:6837335-Pyramimonas_sp.AAC.1
MALQGAGAGDGGGNAPGDMHAPAVAAGTDIDPCIVLIRTCFTPDYKVGRPDPRFQSDTL